MRCRQLFVRRGQWVVLLSLTVMTGLVAPQRAEGVDTRTWTKASLPKKAGWVVTAAILGSLSNACSVHSPRGDQLSAPRRTCVIQHEVPVTAATLVGPLLTEQRTGPGHLKAEGTYPCNEGGPLDTPSFTLTFNQPGKPPAELKNVAYHSNITRGGMSGPAAVSAHEFTGDGYSRGQARTDLWLGVGEWPEAHGTVRVTGEDGRLSITKLEPAGKPAVSGQNDTAEMVHIDTYSKWERFFVGQPHEELPSRVRYSVTPDIGGTLPEVGRPLRTSSLWGGKLRVSPGVDGQPHAALVPSREQLGKYAQRLATPTAYDLGTGQPYSSAGAGITGQAFRPGDIHAELRVGLDKTTPWVLPVDVIYAGHQGARVELIGHGDGTDFYETLELLRIDD